MTLLAEFDLAGQRVVGEVVKENKKTVIVKAKKNLFRLRATHGLWAVGPVPQKEKVNYVFDSTIKVHKVKQNARVYDDQDYDPTKVRETENTV